MMRIMGEDHAVQSEDVVHVIVDVTNPYRQVQYLAKKWKECYSEWVVFFFSYMNIIRFYKMHDSMQGFPTHDNVNEERNHVNDINTRVTEEFNTLLEDPTLSSKVE